MSVASPFSSLGEGAPSALPENIRPIQSSPRNALSSTAGRSASSPAAIFRLVAPEGTLANVWKDIIHFKRNSPVTSMEEIIIKVPKGLPRPYLKKKIDDLVREEELKWALFERCKEELSLTEDDLEELEKAREMAWNETRKKYGL